MGNQNEFFASQLSMYCTSRSPVSGKQKGNTPTKPNLIWLPQHSNKYPPTSKPNRHLYLFFNCPTSTNDRRGNKIEFPSKLHQFLMHIESPPLPHRCLVYTSLSPHVWFSIVCRGLTRGQQGFLIKLTKARALLHCTCGRVLNTPELKL